MSPEKEKPSVGTLLYHIGSLVDTLKTAEVEDLKLPLRLRSDLGRVREAFERYEEEGL